MPITPCRLFDTRPEFQVGSRSAPLGPGDIHTIDATGTNGNCTDIPTTATAVSMNMTSTDATAPTFLTVWASGQPQPDTSSMNPIPGAPATPNGIISALDADGEFNVFNLAGNVHVFADINGYYTDHHHDDRYYTMTQTDSRYYTETEIDAKLTPSSIMVTAGDLRETTPWSATRFGVARSGGVNACAYAPVSILAGRTIASFDIRYVAQAVEVEVRLRQDEFAEGFVGPYDLVTSGVRTLDGVGSNEFYYALDTLAVVGPAAVLPDMQHQLEICSAATIEVNAVRINFSD